jgi:hypothetical protein
VVASTPWPLYPYEKALSTHLLEYYVGSRSRLDKVEQKKNSCLYRKSNYGHPIEILPLNLTRKVYIIRFSLFSLVSADSLAFYLQWNFRNNVK